MELETISTTKLITATQNINLSDLENYKTIPFQFSAEDSHTYSGYINWIVGNSYLDIKQQLQVYMLEVAFLQIEFKDMEVSSISGKKTGKAFGRKLWISSFLVFH